MSSDSTSLVIILVCLVLSAYFSATETAFSTMSHARMKTMADKGDKSAALALPMPDMRFQKAVSPAKSSHLALQLQFSATAANNRPYRGLDSLHRVFS